MKADEYRIKCNKVKKDRNGFWKQVSLDLIQWSKPCETIYSGSLGSDSWFPDGELNACYNCLDRWTGIFPNKHAIIFQNNSGIYSTYTYKEALDRVFQICNWLTTAAPGCQKGEVLTIYMSTQPDAIFTMLACARLGVTHNVVFGGFSASALRLRLVDSSSRFLVTQIHSQRGDKQIDFLDTVLTATTGLSVTILLFDSEKSPSSHSNVVSWASHTPSSAYVPWVSVNSEHPLFILYTSGSTGKPKGLIHRTGGYLTYAAYSHCCSFDIKPDDVFFCTADIGWITGHSYCVYAPLCLGITSVIMEGLPTYPTQDRLFSVIQSHSVTQLYTAPTTIRVIKAYFGANWKETVSKYNLSSLRMVGTVGEPVGSEAYLFYSECFGNLHVVDTYFQTETGGILVAPIPGVGPGVPGCAGYPLPGIEVAVESDVSGFGRIFVRSPWPGIAKDAVGGGFLERCFVSGMYFTGDEGTLDTEGRLWVRGRADDVINVSGHRISTAEVESAVCSDEVVTEAAVVAIKHAIKGQAMVLFVVPRELVKNLGGRMKQLVAEKIGGFCRPDVVISCSGIPKTATGKLMRRVLRAIITGGEVGDLSTCINKEAVTELLVLCSMHKGIGGC